MVTAPMMAIAAGHEDADDLDALRFDPALMLACNREPEGGHGIPSQPTISRLENVPDARTLYKIGIGYIDFFCRSYGTPPESIVLDIDDTDDLVHGGQQLALFNTHAGGHRFQPIHIFEGNSGKPILSLLRPGKRPSGEEIARVLWHVIHRIRRHWPDVRILVRGDGHYCAPEVLDLLHHLRCDYILGLPINAKLDAIAEPWREQCEQRREAHRSKKVRRMHQLTYQAGSWSRAEKVIARVEATEMGSDARFVVTNLTGRAKVLYEKVYCARGRMENMIKDLKLYTRSDKTACSRWAGQPVPPVPAHGRLLVAALGAARGAQEIALARRPLRHDPLGVRQDRVPRRGAQDQDQAVVPRAPAACRRHHRRHRPALRPGAIVNAAGRRSSQGTTPTRSCSILGSPRRKPGRRLTHIAARSQVRNYGE
jgi:hypothetical protein